MWQLILKDIEQHAKAILIFFLSALVVPVAFALVFSQTQEGSGYQGVVFGYIGLGAPALFAFWFIGQEKVKGTFKFLSILPIPGRKLIMAKSLSSVLLSLAIVNLAAVIVPVIFHLVAGFSWTPSTVIVAWLNLLIIFFVSVDVAIFTLLEVKIASQVIYLGHAFVGLVVVVAAKYFPIASDPDRLLARLNAVGFQYWGAVPVILATYVIIAFSGRVFEKRDWAELEES